MAYRIFICWEIPQPLQEYEYGKQIQTVRTRAESVLRAFPGRFVVQQITIAARIRASKRPQGQKKTPGNDNVSIIIPRRLSAEFIADT